jgi:glycosyltransferase involved in cell wall biosynthesis
MKILISSLTYPLPNGVTVSIDATIDGLIEKGDEVLVISPDYYKKKHRPEHRPVASSSVTHTIGSLIGKEERTFGLSAFGQIKRIAEKFDPDIYWLHTLSYAPNFFERYMLKSNKAKILTYHTLVEEYGRMYAGEIGANLMKKRSEIVANQMDAVIVPSKIIAEKLGSYGVTVPKYPIPTGIAKIEKYFSRKELSEKFGIPEDSKILLYVGRICKEKNIGSLLRVMEKIKKENPSAFLLIVGPGDIEEFKAVAKEKNIADRIIFTGPLPAEEAQRIYGGCDVFTFPSKSETQGLVIGEAMMANIPVVAFYSQIQPEIYPEDIALVAEDESQFAKAVLGILDDKEKRKEIVDKAKKFVVANFSRPAMTRKQRELFQKVSKNIKKS